MPENAKRSMWVGIGTYVLSGFAGAIFAAFIFGGARQKVVNLGKDMDDWKRDWKEIHAPHIERMDSQGTLSFEHFHSEYLRNQTRQEERIKELEKELREFQRGRRP